MLCPTRIKARGSIAAVQNLRRSGSVCAMTNCHHIRKCLGRRDPLPERFVAQFVHNLQFVEKATNTCAAKLVANPSIIDRIGASVREDRSLANADRNKIVMHLESGRRSITSRIMRLQDCCCFGPPSVVLRWCFGGASVASVAAPKQERTISDPEQREPVNFHNL
jgi:hypothetical protein